MTEQRPLWEWRAVRRLSKTALAAAAKVSRNTVADIEKGEQEPNLATMRKLARALDVEVEQIIWPPSKTLAPVA